MLLVAKIIDREGKIRALSKAIYYLNMCMTYCTDFDPKINRELETHIRSIILRQIIDKEESIKQQALMLEILSQKDHLRMSALRDFFGKELYKVYLKLASISMEDPLKIKHNVKEIEEVLNKCRNLKN